MIQLFLKTAFGFTLFFFLFYLEPINIGNFSIAIIWKVGLMIVLFFGLLHKIGDARLNKLTAWGVLFGAIALLNESLFLDPVETISFAIKNLFIPIIYGFWLSRVDTHTNFTDQRLSLFLTVSIFIVLSTIPFHLNLITPLSSGYKLSLFDASVQDVFGFVGIFQNAHGASVTITTATLTLLWFLPYCHNKPKFLFNVALIAIGALSVVLTLVRTGVAMLFIGVFVLLLVSRKRIHFLVSLAIIVTTFVVGLYLFETSDLFRMRVLGENIYTQQTLSTTQIGSGRTLFWETAMENYFSKPFVIQLFGSGPFQAKEDMLAKLGQRIYAHNGFVDILQFYGYIGLLAYLMMFSQIVKVVFSLKRSDPYFTLAILYLSSYLIQMLVQGERFFLADLLFALVLVGAKVVGQRTRVGLSDA